jgi:hypothetical protein
LRTRELLAHQNLDGFSQSNEVKHSLVQVDADRCDLPTRASMGWSAAE